MAVIVGPSRLKTRVAKIARSAGIDRSSCALARIGVSSLAMLPGFAPVTAGVLEDDRELDGDLASDPPASRANPAGARQRPHPSKSPAPGGLVAAAEPCHHGPMAKRIVEPDIQPQDTRPGRTLSAR
jgi:hypothetical protein